jgi:ribonuclease D
MASAKQRKTLLFKEARRKFGRAEHRPQDEFPLFMDSRRIINNRKSWPIVNPVKSVVLQWQPTLAALAVTRSQPKGLARIINDEQSFQLMMEDIEAKLEIAVDMEGHQDHSYMGMTMYIQISSKENDYIVYVPSVFDLIVDKLKPLFESLKIIKVFHGGQNDVLQLQRDFSIYIRAYVDTQMVYNYLYGPPPNGNLIGMKTLVEELLGKRPIQNLVECAQLADWRIKPLPKAMFEYAQFDSSCLFEVWQVLKKQLQDGGWKDSSNNPFRASNVIASSVYKQKKFASSFEDRGKYPVNDNLYEVYDKVHQWRQERARYVDEPPSEVFTSEELQKLIIKSPTTMEGLKAIFPHSRLPRWIRGVEDELVGIIANQLCPKQADNQTNKDWIDEDMDILQIHAPNISVETNTTGIPIIESHDKSTVQVEVESPLSNELVDIKWTREVRAPDSLPVSFKKWTSAPPGGKQQLPKHLTLHGKEPKRLHTRGPRIPLSEESRKYGQRRRKFNNRRNRQARKMKITLSLANQSNERLQEEDTSGGDFLSGGV